jgi:hypothetical protein
MIMTVDRMQYARPVTWVMALTTCVALIGAPFATEAPAATAQAPAATATTADSRSPQEIEKLVGPIALYPDDLVAIILPASTNPLQLVQAERFIEKRKKDAKLPIDDKWDSSVKSLVNYPEVIKQMSADLDWTTDLGEAVVADQGAVLNGVQAFRRRAQGAGNLKTDPKQVVVVEKEIVKIVPADPQVIYVPQYNPTTVVVVSSTPVYGYYPAPYPVYYYPYPPGAALATGLVWGAAIGAAWNGNHYGTNWSGGNNNITINRGNTNINTGNINTGNINRAQTTSVQNTAWKSDKKPGQVSTGAVRPTTTSARVGDARASSAAGTGATGRPAIQPTGATGQRAAGANATPTSPSTRSNSAGGGTNAFSDYGSGSAARADSSRGAASRNSMSSGGRSTAGGGRSGTAGGRGRAR